MKELLRKRYYLSAAEFAVCCGAAGLDRLCGFPVSGKREAGLGQVLLAMQRDGLLQMGEESFRLCPALSVCVRRIAGGTTTALAFRDRYDVPCSLLYGGADGYVSLEPGARPGEYAGLAPYGADELEAWISEAGLAMSPPERSRDTTPEEDAEEIRMLYKLLQSSPWPPGGSCGEALLEKLRGCVEFRGAFHQELLGRIYLFQGPFAAWILAETESGPAGEKYEAEALAIKIHDRMEGVGK